MGVGRCTETSHPGGKLAHTSPLCLFGSQQCCEASPWYVPVRLIGLVVPSRSHVGHLMCHADPRAKQI